MYLIIDTIRHILVASKWACMRERHHRSDNSESFPMQAASHGSPDQFVC